MDLSIVVPVYNEEESISKLYQALVPVLVRMKKKHEIIFIDDGSTDNSFNILSEISKRDSTVRVIKFSGNSGQTAALLAGFENAKGSVIVTLDADLQNDPADIPVMLNKLNEGYDVVCGWRFPRNDPIGKKVASKFSNFLMKNMLNLKIHDSGCTLRAYKKAAIQNINIYGETHRYLPAIIAAKGFKVTEMKVKHKKREFGKTKYGAARLPKGFLDMLAIKFLTKYGRRPIHVFGGLGLFMFGIGFIGGLYLVYLKFFEQAPIGNRPLLFLVLILLIMGVQFVLNGFIAELLIRTTHDESYSIEKEV